MKISGINCYDNSSITRFKSRSINSRKSISAVKSIKNGVTASMLALIALAYPYSAKTNTNSPLYTVNINDSLESEQHLKPAKMEKINEYSNNLASTGLFENNNLVAEHLCALGIKNFKCSNKESADKFYLESDNYKYELNIGKAEDDAYTGILNRISTNGKTEKFLIRTEMYSNRIEDVLIIFKIKLSDKNDYDALLNKKLSKSDIKDINNFITSDEIERSAIKTVKINKETRAAIVQGE